MNISKLAIERPVSTMMVFVTFVLVGLIASYDLKQEFFPEIQFPGIYIEIPYESSTAEEVEKNITRPIEEVLATISNIDRLTSTSRSNGATIIMFFDWEENAKLKGVEAREKIDAIRHELPSDLRDILVFTGSTNDQPVLQIRISSEQVDLKQSYDLLDRRLKRPLEKVPGVSKVDIYGISEQEVMIELDLAKVNAHNVDLLELSQRLSQANFSISGGDFVDNKRRYYVKPEGEFRSIEDIQSYPIGVGKLRLDEIAKVYYRTTDLDHGRHLNRKFAAGLSISRESDSNIVDVADAVIVELDRIRASKELEGINIFVMENQAEGIRSSLSDISTSGFIGFCLSVLVLYFFLRQIKMTIIVALAVPFALLITLAFMYFLDVSLNILSMMGLMLAVGMLVDNAVVISESIYRFKEKFPDEPVKASILGVREVGVAVVAGTLTTAIVFLPNIIGEKINVTVFLSHVAITICIALGASLFIAITIIPLFLAKADATTMKASDTAFFRWLSSSYARLIQWTLDHRKLANLIAVGALFSVAIPGAFVKTDMFPEEERTRLQLEYHIKGSHTVERVKEIVDSIEETIYGVKEEIGLDSIYSFYRGDTASSTLLLVEDRSNQLAPSMVKKKILELLPKYSIAEPSFTRERTGGEEAIKIYINGESTEQLIEISNSVVPLLQSLEGLHEVRSDYDKGNAEVQITFNRLKLIELGLKTDGLSRQIASAIRGQTFRTLRTQQGETEIKMRLGNDEIQQLDNLYQLPIILPTGESIPLSALANFKKVSRPTSIFRENRRTTLGITLALDGLTMQEAKDILRKNMDELNLPSGYSWSFGRSFDNEDLTGRILLRNMLLAVMMIYIVMAALFESLVFPTAVITSIVYSIVGVYWFFLLTGTTLSMMANIGILVLMGIVVNNGIVFIERINQLRQEGYSREKAVVEAGQQRLRPILMTAATTILGLIPLALGGASIGGDGPSYFPMARAIIGGLTFSTVITLLVLPTIYLNIDNVRQWAGRVVALSRAEVAKVN